MKLFSFAGALINPVTISVICVKNHPNPENYKEPDGFVVAMGLTNGKDVLSDFHQTSQTAFIELENLKVALEVHTPLT